MLDQEYNHWLDQEKYIDDWRGSSEEYVFRRMLQALESIDEKLTSIWGYIQDVKLDKEFEEQERLEKELAFIYRNTPQSGYVTNNKQGMAVAENKPTTEKTWEGKSAFQVSEPEICPWCGREFSMKEIPNNCNGISEFCCPDCGKMIKWDGNSLIEMD